MNRFVFLTLSVVTSAFSSSCITHAVRVEPIALEPVQVTMDVNLHVDDTRSQSESSGTEPSSAGEHDSQGDAGTEEP